MIYPHSLDFRVNAKLLLFTAAKGQAILSILLTHLNLKISFTPITITKHQQQYYPYTIISSTTAR